jgi:hypothetical protein
MTTPRGLLPSIDGPRRVGAPLDAEATVTPRRSVRILLLAMLLAAGSSVGLAEGWSVGGGGMIPEGNFSDVAENGYHAFVGYAWKFGPVEVEPALRYMWADGVAGAADVKMFGGEVSGRVHILFFYGVGGLGYYQVERSLSLDNAIEIDSWDFSYSIGAGVEFGPIFLEARYQVIESERNTAFFPLTVGFRF